MDMIFQFRTLSDEAENFSMDFEVRYDTTLLDLHNFIAASLGYNPMEMASFFLSDSEWEKLREFTLFDMGTDNVDIDPDDEIEPPVQMGGILLSQVIRQKFDRLLYVFDFFTERQLFIELLEAKIAQDGVEYPRILELKGIAPVQFAGLPQDELIDREIEEDFMNLQGEDLFDDDSED